MHTPPHKLALMVSMAGFGFGAAGSALASTDISVVAWPAVTRGPGEMASARDRALMALAAVNDADADVATGDATPVIEGGSAPVALPRAVTRPAAVSASEPVPTPSRSTAVSSRGNAAPFPSFLDPPGGADAKRQVSRRSEEGDAVLARLAAVMSAEAVQSGWQGQAVASREPSHEPVAQTPLEPSAQYTEAARAEGSDVDIDLGRLAAATKALVDTTGAVLPSVDVLLDGVSAPLAVDIPLDLPAVMSTASVSVDVLLDALAQPDKVDFEIELLAHGPAAPTIEVLRPSRLRPMPAQAYDEADSDGHWAAERAQWVAIGEDRLDRVRGGFSTGSLNISFGIERAVYINGSLVTTTRLSMSDLNAIRGTGVGNVQMNGGTVALVQSGQGNTFLPGNMAPGSVGTVIQNTLNNQKIQSITTIDATANSLQILKGMNLQSSLRNAVVDSLRR